MNMKLMRGMYIVFGFIIMVISLGSGTDALAAGSSGIEVGLDSARALGKGNAVVADPQDASTLVYNPAGLARLDGTQIALNHTILVPQFEYTSTNGTSENLATMPAYIPAFFMSMETPIEQLTIGGGVNAPFGAVNQYDSTGNFKYTGITSEIKTIYYTLDGAYQLTPELAVGGGISYVESRLRQISKLNGTLIGLGSGGDFNTEIDANGHGMGWNMGVLVTPNEKWSLGFSYKSAVRTPMDGEYNADNIPAGGGQAVFGGPSFRTSLSTDMTFPDSAVIGVNYKATDKLDLEVDLGWTGWGKWDQFDFLFGTTNAVLNGSDPSRHKFRDTLSVNVGAAYKLNPNWDIMTGYAYFQRAALEPDYSNVFPDGDRHNITVGLQYHVKQFTIAVAYDAQFVSEFDVDNTVGNTVGASVDGTYEGFYHVFLTSVTYKFN